MKRAFIVRALCVATAAALVACAGETVERTSRNGGENRGGASLPTPPTALESLRAAAVGRRVVIEAPRFEETPEEVAVSVDAALARAGERLDYIATQNASAATFQSVFAALDHALHPVVDAFNRTALMMETQQGAAMREACGAQVRRLQSWFVELQYREDLYAVCRAFEEAYAAGRRRALAGEDLRLFEETMRDYRRAGLHLDAATRGRVEALQKELASLSTDFGENITNADAPVVFTREELAGVPEAALDQFARGDGTVELRASVTPEFLAVMNNARSEAARLKMKTARYSIVMEENGAILNQIVRVRDEIAGLLGYGSWGDYQIEPKMAKTAQRAEAFASDLAEGLGGIFQKETQAMRALKIEETGDPDAQIEHWDWRYYDSLYRKREYDVDAEALRVYFPLEATLAGMFDIYETIFGLRFEELEPPQKWVDDLALYAAYDLRTGKPMGLFYLDLFPRPGKYNHFAQFDIVTGGKTRDGRDQRAVVALVCNFPAPTEDAPSLLSHSEVETLFHEFGHALHSILSETTYNAFAGTNVPRDFVEAPSQMLENWVWDAGVLNRFAADYRNPSKKIDQELLDRMDAARSATIATFYRRQLAFAIADLRLHAPPSTGADKDAQRIVNETLADVFYPPPPGTHFAAYWGHLTGYDAGYYGYAWADAIAADLATAFKEHPDGLMSVEVGMRLRDEIYGVGGSRDIEDSIRAFLGRERSLAPFLESLGVENNARTSADPAAQGQ